MTDPSLIVFHCSFCGSVETVRGVPTPLGFIYGSKADFCEACGKGRRWESDDESPDIIFELEEEEIVE